MTAGEEVSWIDPDSSRAYIYKGHKVSVEMCVQGMIIPSGNDAAYVLAVNAGRVISGDANISARGAYDAFVAEMNRQAQELGLTGTHFVNPDGMNEKNHYTTMRDLVTIAKLALDNTIIAEAAAIQKMTAIFPSGHFAEWTNSNVLLDKNSSYYCANAIGLKTGSTSTAGKCLISAFQRDGKVYLICVMGCSTNNSRYDDTLALYKAVCCN
jgi:D-alanyl-D-alanine carboxypeptidase (penicillin-binding protein 5/6)